MNKIIAFFVFILLLCNTAYAYATDENSASKKFQQYNQEVSPYPVDYYNIHPYIYNPVAVQIMYYAPETYQYLDERDRINKSMDKETSTNPETYNIKRN